MGEQIRCQPILVSCFTCLTTFSLSTIHSSRDTADGEIWASDKSASDHCADLSPATLTCPTVTWLSVRILTLKAQIKHTSRSLDNSFKYQLWLKRTDVQYWTILARLWCHLPSFSYIYVRSSIAMGGRHSSLVSSVPTILWPRVRIPCTPSTLFSICFIVIVIRK